MDIIVLGCRVNGDGQCGATFRHRLDRAFELYRGERCRGRPARIIVSGGDFLRQGVSEARAGSRYLAETAGAPPADLVVEEKAVDTLGNAAFTKVILLESGCRTPFVVTSSYHLPRASYVFTQVLGPEFDPTYVAAPAGLDPDEYRRRWSLEASKTVRAARFFQSIDLRPGDHERVLAFLHKQGLLAGGGDPDKVRESASG